MVLTPPRIRRIVNNRPTDEISRTSLNPTVDNVITVMYKDSRIDQPSMRVYPMVPPARITSRIPASISRRRRSTDPFAPRLNIDLHRYRGARNGSRPSGGRALLVRYAWLGRSAPARCIGPVGEGRSVQKATRQGRRPPAPAHQGPVRPPV